MRKRSILTALACSFLLALSPLAAAPVIERGIDVFSTPANGKTSYDFARSPIPANFFCKGSKPFSGRIAFKGLPLATEIPGQLGAADTVVERLDDAVFDSRGVAWTRLQFRALSLVSISPIKTACGAFHAYVSLADKQRVTTMRILRTREKGGSFAAPLAVDVRLTFIPVKPARSVRGKGARKLEFIGSFTFPATPIPWSFTDGTMAKGLEPVVIDTNGDLTPDAQLSGTSSFLAGWSQGSQNKVYCCQEYVCHMSDGCQHCAYVYPRGCTGECP